MESRFRSGGWPSSGMETSAAGRKIRGTDGGDARETTGGPCPSGQRPPGETRVRRDLALLALFGCLLLSCHELGPPFDFWCPGGPLCPSDNAHTTVITIFLLGNRGNFQ